MTQHQTRNKRDQTKALSKKKTLERGKWISLLPITLAITTIDRSCYAVIDSSILQDLFYLSQNDHHAVEKKD